MCIRDRGRITAASGNTVNTDLVGDTSPQLGGNLDVNTKNIVFGDSGSTSDDRLTFGAGTDLSIYHDGTDSRIQSATNVLRILSGDFRVQNAANTETQIKAVQDGAVELYHDNSKKFETTSVGFTAGTLSTSSTGAYMTISDSSSYGLIIDQSASKNITIRTDGPSINLNQKTNGEYYIRCLKDAAVELYHNGTKKLETSGSGVEIVGQTTSTGNSANFRAVESGGATVKIQCGGSEGYIGTDTNHKISFITNGSSAGNGGRRWEISGYGSFIPYDNNTYDIGSSSYRVRNIYTNDLHLSLIHI